MPRRDCVSTASRQLALALTDASMEAIARGLRPGMAEWEIPALIEPVYLREGGTAGIHFITSMICSSVNLLFFIVRLLVTDSHINCGTLRGAGHWGYSGQIHRTYSLGEGPTPEWKALHEVAVDMLLELEALIKDGVTTGEVEDAANLVHRRGYTILDDLLHGTSQTPPIIQTGETRRHVSRDITFRENMTIVIQPNVMTLDERMGVQFGETFRVTRDGLERFNAFPREWVVCG